jgi:hypothetical protein
MSEQYLNDGIINIRGLSFFCGIQLSTLQEILRKLISEEADRLIAMHFSRVEDEESLVYMNRLRAFVWALEESKKSR